MRSLAKPHVCLLARAVVEKVRALAAAAARAPPPAAAVGPQRAPSAPASEPGPAYTAAPPSAAAGNGTFLSSGDWTGRARHAAVKCTDPPGDPPGRGRCTNRCDQLYNTCPLPTDLPKGKVPDKGSPVGSDPPLKMPAPLTTGEVDDAVSKGLLKKGDAAKPGAEAIDGTAAYASSAGQPAAPRPAHTNSSAAIEAISINAGDSWAIRNSNCEIAPIHGVLNRVRTEL